MKKIVVALLSFISLTAFAQEVERTTKNIICVRGVDFSESIKQQYGEVPVFGGKLAEFDGVFVGVYFNEKTKTFTIVEFNNEKTCVITAGNGGMLGPKANM